MPQLAFDSRDDQLFEQRGMRNLYWLDDLGAVPLTELDPDAESFLYAGARSIEDYRTITTAFAKLNQTTFAIPCSFERPNLLGSWGAKYPRCTAKSN